MTHHINTRMLRIEKMLMSDVEFFYNNARYNSIVTRERLSRQIMLKKHLKNLGSIQMLIQNN
jgi:hypothetical protein